MDEVLGCVQALDWRDRVTFLLQTNMNSTRNFLWKTVWPVQISEDMGLKVTGLPKDNAKYDTRHLDNRSSLSP